MKGFTYLVLVLLFFSKQTVACEKPILVLVPGFFNLPAVEFQLGLANENSSLIEYFSSDIISAIEDKGFKSIILRNLNPIGTVKVNGHIVQADLEQIINQHPGCKINVIAHSAGGMYVAQALTTNPNLSLNTVVTISTPYEGAELIDLVSWIPGWETVADVIHLESLVEFDELQATKVLHTLKIPENLRWIALGAFQKPCHLLNCKDARQISWLLSLAWQFTPSVGDGVVALESAILQQGTLANTDGGIKTVERWPDFVIPLEHWEMFVDSNLFELIGVKNTNWVRAEQKKFMTKIIERAF